MNWQDEQKKVATGVSQKREWVGLTEKEQDAVFKTFSRSEAHKLNFLNRVASAIEAKLKEKK